MAVKKHIDEILKHWPYDASQLAVRIVSGKDSRDVIQMRIDMGILQLETTGRPDGTMPEGSDTYYDHLVSQAADQGEELVMSEDHCNEADREFVQYYHRRVCWLTLREFPRAVDDAQHTLALMDFCRKWSQGRRRQGRCSLWWGGNIAFRLLDSDIPMCFVCVFAHSAERPLRSPSR